MKVTAYNFAAIVSASGSTFVGVTTETPLKHNVKSRKNPALKWDMAFKGEVITHAKRVVTIGISYENTVNNQRVREEKEKDFEAKPLKWGNWWMDSKVIIEHNKELYLRYYPKLNAHKDEVVLKYEDGTPLTDAELALLPEFTSEKAPSKTQDLNKEIEVRTITVSNIKRAKVNRVEYEII